MGERVVDRRSVCAGGASPQSEPRTTGVLRLDCQQVPRRLDNIGANLAGEPLSSQTRRQHRALRRTPRNHGLTVAPQHLAATRRPWTGYEATSENTGGSRVATVDQLAPASPEPNTSPEVAPK